MLMRALSTFVLLIAFSWYGPFAQGVTTSSMQGKIQDRKRRTADWSQHPGAIHQLFRDGILWHGYDVAWKSHP